MARPPHTLPPDGKPAKDLGPLRMIWREALKYPWQVAIALVALVVSSAATLAIPYRFRVIIDRAFGAHANVTVINHSFYYLFMIVVVLGLASAIRFYYVSWLGERVVADLRRRVQDNLLRLSPAFFEENSPKEISSRMTSDTTVIDQVVGTTVSLALRNIITGLGGIVMLFVLAPRESSFLVGGALVIAVMLRVFGRKIRNISRSSQDRIADVGAMVSEVLGAMKIVQGFNQERASIRNGAKGHGSPTRWKRLSPPRRAASTCVRS
jgi:ATP-binding cassette subfamily B protein